MFFVAQCPAELSLPVGSRVREDDRIRVLSERSMLPRGNADSLRSADFTLMVFSCYCISPYIINYYVSTCNVLSISTYATSSPCIIYLLYECYVYCYRTKINIPETVTENPKTYTADQGIQTLESYENSIIIESVGSAEFHDEQPST